jgi:photosystem II stability/assembly factor-like uncharacterized protein
MNKKTNMLKAAIVVAIALALIIPGAAMATNMKTQEIKEIPYAPVSKTGGWVEQASGFWEASRGIHYIHAVDENVVWATAYDGINPSNPNQEFTKTINGGELWEADIISEAPEDARLAMIFALDDMTAWVPIHSGDPQGIWKTSDGGDHWVQQVTAAFSGAGAFPNIVHFWNQNDGWCQGDPVDGYYEMYTTTDGGDTWIRVPEVDIPAPAGAGEYGVVGYYDVVGDTVWWGTQWNSGNGRVFKSTDKGYTWSVYDTDFPAGCYIDVRMKDENNGLAMDKRDGGSTLAETSDGGETWTPVTPTGYFYDNDIAYVPGTYNTWISTGAATGISGASYSIDGGHFWEDYTAVAGTQLLDCDFIEGGIGWAGSFNEDEFTGGMYKYTPSEEADLSCSGDIAWVDVTPGETVTDSFTVQNTGGAGSELDWEIESYPDWGDWTFDPDGGLDLTPEDGVITVDVEVVAPPDEETEFEGEIVLVNSEDPEDTCTIDIALTTPVSQESPIFQFLERIFERFPNAFPILRNLLGL